jgi:ferredoxin-thioredoxin reductase catalytic subunit/glutaredoxin
MATAERTIIVYALSTCMHCKKTLELLAQTGVHFERVYVDALKGEKRADVLARVREYNPRISFPTVVVDGGARVIVGFRPEALRELSALPAGESREEEAPAPDAVQIDRLHAALKALQEPKGYYFNEDLAFTRALLGQLLNIKAREGYMRCPCRIGNGAYEQDKDIICPCVYREQDVKEYNACFCGLYVSREWNEGNVPRVQPPDRRPPENVVF